jgi:hypothetical protein
MIKFLMEMRLLRLAPSSGLTWFCGIRNASTEILETVAKNNNGNHMCRVDS